MKGADLVCLGPKRDATENETDHRCAAPFNSSSYFTTMALDSTGNRDRMQTNACSEDVSIIRIKHIQRERRVIRTFGVVSQLAYCMWPVATLEINPPKS
jgi:hypothetical protein